MTCRDLEKELPGVTILKPFCNGLDATLLSNLETFFTLEYPKYEILVCVQEEEDYDMKKYTERLRNKYPKVDFQVRKISLFFVL